MVIETERLSDSELVHYYFASAVGEAPLFVGELAKDLLCLAHVIVDQEIDPSERRVKELFAKGDRTGRLSTCS